MARLFLALPILAAGSVWAHAADQYMVEMALWIDGEQRGTPIVVTRADERASIELTDADGESGWRIELLVEANGAAEAASSGAIWMELEIYRREAGALSLLADSLLGVREGRDAVLSVVENADAASEATPENSLVYLIAKASHLRPGAEQRLD